VVDVGPPVEVITEENLTKLYGVSARVMRNGSEVHVVFPMHEKP